MQQKIADKALLATRAGLTIRQTETSPDAPIGTRRLAATLALMDLGGGTGDGGPRDTGGPVNQCKPATAQCQGFGASPLASGALVEHRGQALVLLAQLLFVLHASKTMHAPRKFN